MLTTELSYWAAYLLAEARMHEVEVGRQEAFATHLTKLPYCHELVKAGYFVRASWFSIFVFRLTDEGRTLATQIIWEEGTR